ncbi:dihydroxyacetone kinase subunit DhaK [Actinoplanes regularis]|uniref:Dihydroxyacetone kinase, N-terminal domain n=1 Tax=Actinoplanes regularis TaxID=52697 RepID=A0A238ZNF6_9ACTN|nr:dihydroxyacetone kinase subunit DhaK [Actinoplanes regularis]GIE87552.1 dihydroxyacetone kinase subunit DhaK [Actinoplanes regularis]GLW31681.1 dihydroxyacetone kinase subunit DhaK [Actinoplanes regularis]SNR84860.1 dihydroxyacetone kinase, N-terminal domain [Actinoplanes regularis]
MKKFINDPADVVAQALAGIAAAHPELRVDVEEQYIVRADAPRPGKVALVSGGGSGHEPLHSGFVGPGMLDAACPGEVFTSPVPYQILAATKAVDGGAGVVHIVKNYTGDVLNFQLAAELATDEGISVETVLVDDDVAVEDSTWTAGRRGTGATLLVEKIAGARAEEGGKLAEVAAIGREVNAASGSFAYALTAGTTPAAGRPGFELPADEIEAGVGIHGEPGRRREKLRPARDLVRSALDVILDAKSFDGPVIVLVNGLGGTPLIELYLVYGEVAEYLAERGVPIARRLVGNYVTSLDMAGMSLTLCRATDEMIRLWDAPARTPGLHRGA